MSILVKLYDMSILGKPQDLSILMKPQDLSILVKLHDMSILVQKFSCCACHVARQVVDVLTRQKGNSFTVICFPTAIDVRKYHITEEYEQYSSISIEYLFRSFFRYKNNWRCYHISNSHTLKQTHINTQTPI